MSIIIIMLVDFRICIHQLFTPCQISKKMHILSSIFCTSGNNIREWTTSYHKPIARCHLVTFNLITFPKYKPCIERGPVVTALFKRNFGALSVWRRSDSSPSSPPQNAPTNLNCAWRRSFVGSAILAGDFGECLRSEISKFQPTFLHQSTFFNQSSRRG